MSIVIPVGMPVISHGAHRDAAEGTCLMEYVSFIAGEPFSDHPRTAYPLLAGIARSCNDSYDDDGVLRQGLAPLAVRFVGTRKSADVYNALHTAEGLGHVNELDARLGVWAMGRIAAYIPEDVRLLVQQYCAYLEANLADKADVEPPHDLYTKVNKELAESFIFAPALGAVHRFAKAFYENGDGEHQIAGAVLCAISAVVQGCNSKTAMAGEIEAMLDEFDRLTGHKLTDTTPEPQPEPTNPEPDPADDDKPVSVMLEEWNRIISNLLVGTTQ